jgi:hypothetical protein
LIVIDQACLTFISFWTSNVYVHSTSSLTIIELSWIAYFDDMKKSENLEWWSRPVFIITVTYLIIVNYHDLLIICKRCFSIFIFNTIQKSNIVVFIMTFEMVYMYYIQVHLYMKCTWVIIVFIKKKIKKIKNIFMYKYQLPKVSFDF